MSNRIYSQICTKQSKMKKLLFVFGLTLGGFAFASAQTAVTAAPAGSNASPKAACCSKAGASAEAKPSCAGSSSAEAKACCASKSSTASNTGHAGCAGHAQASTAANGEKPKGNKKGK